ncbi:AI-2E family transporter [Nibricoccus sp. IMCC34717]|uniref:AI-2E family transporter n=1 Tax=Nibricoccus sp. IMCC34717 TaxID=3034021 RepID=UPI00384E87E7
MAATLALFAAGVFGFTQLLGFFGDVLWPLAVAGVLALVLRPLVDLVEMRLKGRRLLAVTILYGAFLLLVAGLALAVLPKLIQQAVDFFAYAPSIAESVRVYAQKNYPDWVSFFERIRSKPFVEQGLSALQAQVAEIPSLLLPSLKAVGQGAFAVLSFFAHFAVLPVYLFFFLLARHEPTSGLQNHLPFLSPQARNDVVFLVQEFVSLVVSFFRGQILIGLIMGVLFSVGFTLVGLKFGLLLGLLVGLLNIIPYLGTIIGLLICLPLAFFQTDGGFTTLLAVLAVKIAVQNIEGWFLTPKIMGERTGLHPVAIIFAIFFWGKALGGILGMILAIPLTAFVVTAWRWVRHRYFNPAMKSASGLE